MKLPDAGTRPPVVLVHGWMMTGRCWEGVATRLRERHRLVTVALPGGVPGAAGRLSFSRPDELVAALAAAVARPALWVGWSLGGLLAQAVACRHAGRAAGVVCVAAPSRFVAGDDWPHGIERAVFDDFAASFARDAESATARFLGWQAAGCGNAKAVLRRLTAAAARPGREAAAALRFLGDCDLREELRGCRRRVDFVAGAEDRLAAPAALAQSASLAKRGHFHRVAGAGHALVFSHPAEVCRIIERHLERGREAAAA